MLKHTLFVMFLVMLLLAACGGSGEPAAPAPSGNAENGKTLFASTTIGDSGAMGCVSCHSLDQGTTLVGPSLAGVGSHPAEWLHESIVNPAAEVAEGFQPGIMPSSYGDDLSQQEIDDLVAYLATLK